jgi:U2 small nuclear ribonucleoprotein B''
VQSIAYAKTKSDTIAKLDGTYKMPEPEREEEPEQTVTQAPGAFGAVPAKAVPVNAPDAAKGQKRARDEEEEAEADAEEDDAEMEMDVSEEESD